MASQGLTDVNGPTARRILAEWNGLDCRDCQRAGGAVRRLGSGAEKAKCNPFGLIFDYFRLYMKIKDVAQCNPGGFPSWNGQDRGRGREIPAASFFNRHVNRIVRIVLRSLYFSMCPGGGESGQQAGLWS